MKSACCGARYKRFPKLTSWSWFCAHCGKKCNLEIESDFSVATEKIDYEERFEEWSNYQGE